MTESAENLLSRYINAWFDCQIVFGKKFAPILKTKLQYCIRHQKLYSRAML